MPTVISRSSITWTLAGDHVHGTYLNGDPWVVGPVSVTAISPATTTLPGGRIVHGTEKNMQRRDDPMAFGDNFLQGLDSGSAGSAYSAPVNAGASLPLALVAGDSIVSVQSDTGAAGWSPCIRRAAVLTVVAAPPAANEFRPPYWYPSRPAQPYVWDDSMLDQLPSVFPASYGANIIAMAARAAELWMTIGQNQGSYLLLPKDQCFPYYRERNIELGYMLIALCSQIPKMQKRDLCRNLCQYGIDLAWAVKNGQYFASRHSTGRKAPIVFMAHVTGFADFQDVNGLCPVGTYTPMNSSLAQDHRVVWGEDGQTFYVEITDAGPPPVINYDEGRFLLPDVDKPEWGNDHWMQQGGGDSSNWATDYGIAQYRKCCSANGWLGMQLGMRAMGLLRMWGHNPWFDYLSRHITEGPSRGLLPWHIDFTDGAMLSLWNSYLTQWSPGGRSIGLAGPADPALQALTVPGTENPWQLRIESKLSVPVAGILIRCAESALRPRRSFWGIPTAGLTFLDEASFQGFVPILVPASGSVVYEMPAIDSAGTSYTLQAALFINDQLVPTNALQVTIVDGV